MDHILRNGRLADVHAQLEQLAVNAWCAPQWISQRHRPNQRTDVSRHGGPADASATLPRPEQAEASAMPCDDRLRLHDDERRAPVCPDARQPDPEASVNRSEGESVRV